MNFSSGSSGREKSSDYEDGKSSQTKSSERRGGNKDHFRLSSPFIPGYSQQFDNNKDIDEYIKSIYESWDDDPSSKTKPFKAMAILFGDTKILRKSLIYYLREYVKLNDKVPETTIHFYKLKNLLGTGSMGKVYLATHLLTNQYVAIKVIKKKPVEEELLRRRIYQEVMIMKRLNHSGITKLFEIFENKKFFFIVTEYAKVGDLFNYLKLKGKIDEDEARLIFKQLVESVSFLHQNYILHRDLKLENILLNEDLVPKITDFSVSCIIRNTFKIKDKCGTPGYIAPEILKNDGYSGFSSDIWSLGICLYLILTGEYPLREMEDNMIEECILKEEYSFSEDLSLDVLTLIKGMLNNDPKKRLTLSQVLTSEWLQNQQQQQQQQQQQDLDIYMQQISQIFNKNEFSNNNNILLKQLDPIFNKIHEYGFYKELVVKNLSKEALNQIRVTFYLLLIADNQSHKHKQQSTNSKLTNNNFQSK